MIPKNETITGNFIKTYVNKYIKKMLPPFDNFLNP